jgi:hypothetical protein
MKIPRAQARGIFAFALLLLTTLVIVYSAIGSTSHLGKIAKTSPSPTLAASKIYPHPSNDLQFQSNLQAAYDVQSLTPAQIRRLGSVTNRSQIYIDGCHSNQNLPIPSQACVFGDLKASRSIWLVGDSHAAQWFVALNDFALKHHYRLVSRTMSSCPFLLGVPKLVDRPKQYWQCQTHNTWLAGKISSDTPSVVVEAGYSGIQSTNLDATLRAMHLLGTPKTKVVILGDTPKPKGAVLDCLAANHKAVQNCFATSDSLGATDLAGKVQAQAAKLGFGYLSLTDWFCVTSKCPATIAGRIIYAQGTHISTEAQQYFESRLELGLLKLLR